MSSTAFVSLALASAIFSFPLASAFSHAFTKPKSYHRVSLTELKYRSLYHGPDVEPPSDTEKQGANFTKMDKDKVHRYGPGDFAQYADSHSSDVFDGGDSEMGLSGDGNVGLPKIGRDVSPHIARTLNARTDQATVSSLSYTDELLQNDPGMDSVRAQQLENWATQQDIAMSNRYMNEGVQCDQGNYYMTDYEYGDIYEDEASFTHPVHVGEDYEDIIPLRAPINGVAAHEIMLKNPYMGYSKFRAVFVGDASNEWSVSPSDGFLKQQEATHFVVRYTPHNSGVSNAYFVIETEDFTKTWKVVGSTGEYGF